MAVRESGSSACTRRAGSRSPQHGAPIGCRTGTRGSRWRAEFTLESRAGTFAATYSGLGEPQPSEPGTLEHFLTERYCLYSAGGTRRAEIHHPPWQLEQAEAEVSQLGITPVDPVGPPLCHYAARQDVLVWRAS